MPRNAADITDLRQLRLLESHARQEILDTVIALGACSVREIAEALGRPADGLYHHVRLLAKGKLLIHAGERDTTPRKEALYAAPTREILRLRYRPADAKHSEAIRRIVAGMVRTAEREFAVGLDPGFAKVDGPRRNINASRQKAWLTPAQHREANRLLARLQQLFQNASPVTGDELLSLTFVMAPIEPSPVRRGA